jgi:hypothetical protein
MIASPPDQELQTVARYLREGTARCALAAERVRRLEAEGRDTSQAERALRDLEDTLAILRQRHQCLALDARSRRLLAVSRERLAAAAAGPRRRPKG